MQEQLNKTGTAIKERYKGFEELKNSILNKGKTENFNSLKAQSKDLMEFVQGFSVNKLFVLFDYYNKFRIMKSNPDEKEKLEQIEIYLKAMHDNLLIFSEVISSLLLIFYLKKQENER